MRILQIFESSTNPAVQGNKTWYKNFYETLVDAGYNVVFYSADLGRKALILKHEGLRKDFSENVHRFFAKEHKSKPFDLCFCYLMEGMFDPSLIDYIRSSNVPVCNFSCNNIHQFYLVEKISHLFDLNLFSEKEARSKFEGINVKSLWWPMASNPKYFHPVKIETDISVSFVGGMYGSRLEHVYQILLNGIDVHMYGPGWLPRCDGIAGRASHSLKQFKRVGASILFEIDFLLRQENILLKKKAEIAYRMWLSNLHELAGKKFPKAFHGKISDAELLNLYSRSKICLGFLEVFDGHSYSEKRLKHMHLRDFEALMAGALYCTDFSDELAEMFEPGKEVIACFDIHDRIEKIKYYLKNVNEGMKIRQQGHLRALNDHTYLKRFEQLFKCFGLETK